LDTVRLGDFYIKLNEELEEGLVHRRKDTKVKMLGVNKVSSLIGQEEHGDLYITSERIRIRE
jgi:hypothetical protein